MYIGYTTGITQRLIDHYTGKFVYASAYKPLFEKYLKSSSGRAFAKKHF